MHCFNWLLRDLVFSLNSFLFSSDFRRRFLSLLSYQFSRFPPSMALSILQNKKSKEETSSKTPRLTNLIRFPLQLTDLIWLVFDLHSSHQLRAGVPLQPLWPQTSGVVFEEHGGLPPHHGPDPDSGSHVFPQAARGRLSVSRTVCKFRPLVIVSVVSLSWIISLIVIVPVLF